MGLHDDGLELVKKKVRALFGPVLVWGGWSFAFAPTTLERELDRVMSRLVVWKIGRSIDD